MGDKTLGICVVGAGALGSYHARCWAEVEAAQLVAVTDVDAERAQRLAEDLGFKAWMMDYRDAVASGEVDVVSVCTPTFYHPDITIFAAEHGKHILCEKPMALTMEAADRMMEATSANGVKLGMGFQRRYSEHSEKLRQLVQDGEIGRPVMFRFNASAPIRVVVGKPAMHDMLRGNGGPVVDQCCHFFDLWRMVFDAEPTRVTARGFTFAKDRPELAHLEQLAPDTAAIIVEHDSGDLGVVTITWGLPPGVRGGSMDDILGPEGAIVFGRDEINLVKEGGEEHQTTGFSRNTKLAQVRHFAQCVLEEEEPNATGENGRIALRVSLGALESMKTGQPVSLS